MRPDPRLLVPCDALPFVPRGATVWTHSGRHGLVVLDEGRGILMAFDTTEVLWYARDAFSLDLSRPDERGGVPTRWDMFEWGMRVLGWCRVDFGISTEGPHTVWIDDIFTGPQRPELADLVASGDAERAVVAAALRARNASVEVADANR